MLRIWASWIYIPSKNNIVERHRPTSTRMSTTTRRLWNIGSLIYLWSYSWVQCSKRGMQEHCYLNRLQLTRTSHNDETESFLQSQHTGSIPQPSLWAPMCRRSLTGGFTSNDAASRSYFRHSHVVHMSSPFVVRCVSRSVSGWEFCFISKLLQNIRWCRNRILTTHVVEIGSYSLTWISSHSCSAATLPQFSIQLLRIAYSSGYVDNSCFFGAEISC